MPGATAATRPSVNAFPVDATILMKHYFDGEVVFDRLRPYYNGNQYRFEVPVSEFDSLRRFLRSHGYDVSVVERSREFYVAVRQYSAHPDGIFASSVRQESVDGFNCFLMKDRTAVEAAVAEGATPITELPLTLEPDSLTAFAEPI